MSSGFKTRRSRDLFQLAMGLIIIVFVNYITSYKFKRFDLTAEKRYSLSDSTKKILRNLDDNMLVTVYLEGKDLNVDFKRLKNATYEILSEFRYYAKGSFEFRFIDPFAETDEEMKKQMYYELVDKGLTPTDIFETTADGKKMKQIFPGAIVAYGGKEVAVQLLESQFNQSSQFVLNQSIERLEYNFAKAFYKVMHYQEKKTIAFSRGHGELYEMYLADIVDELRDYYEVVAVDIDDNLNSLKASQVNCLVIAKPDTMFDDASKFILDQYIMNGGRVLWLMDNVFTSLDSLGDKNYTVAFPQDLGLYDQLFKYGVRINPTIIQDNECAQIPIVTGHYGTQNAQDLYPWYYYPVITPDGKHPIVKNLNSIKLEFANSMDTITTPGIKKTVLLHTSDLTKVLFTPTRISLNSIEQKPTPEQFNKQNVPVAVLLEGEFNSIFANRIVELSNQKLIAKSEPTKMIVVSDGDIIKNAYNRRDGSTMPLGVDPMSGTYYAGNKMFILNSINYLTDDTWFIPLRSKQYRIRLLNKTKLDQKMHMGGSTFTRKALVKVINIVVPVLIIVIFGLIFNKIRKRRFA